MSRRKRAKHEWELSGGGDWEVWTCRTCNRWTFPTMFGFLWPWPRCVEVEK